MFHVKMNAKRQRIEIRVKKSEEKERIKRIFLLALKQFHDDELGL